MKYLISLLAILSLSVCFDMQMTYSTKYLPVYSSSQLNKQFNDSTFVKMLQCDNGQLQIIQVQHGLDIMQFSFNGDAIDQYTLMVDPDIDPHPSIINTSPNSFQIQLNCPQDITKSNYYNRVMINLASTASNTSYPFSFLMDCDPENRHKKFEFGYLLIALLDAVILVGVALHSRIWSIRWRDSPLRFELTWKVITGIMIVVIGLGGALYGFAKQHFKQAFIALKYFGIVFSVPFVFICWNQGLFLYFPFRKQIFKSVRICQVLSLVGTLLVLLISIFFQNWIVFNVVAVCICIGSIKLFHFSSLFQTSVSMLISTVTVSIVAIILHYILPRSYNDYASELSSPLFLQFPDLVNNLYKKCSWLPVLDVVVPGVGLSFLRTYDQNYSTSWGGVYTITGNLSFIIGTVLWILIQALYPFSVPFSLVTYPFLLLWIVIVAYKRNQLKTLWRGTFHMDHQSINASLLQENRNSFSKMITPDMMGRVSIGEQSEDQFKVKTSGLRGKPKSQVSN